MALVVATNSYGSRTEADSYFDDSLRKDIWKAFTGGDRDKALVEVTRLLERQPWAGTKEISNQVLAFPRVSLVDCQGNNITAAQSLLEIKAGQFEYAYALLQDNDLISQTDNSSSNLKKVEAGSAKVTYFKGKAGSKYPVPVLSIIKCFFDNTSAASGMTVSGNTDCSSFYGGNPLISGFK